MRRSILPYFLSLLLTLVLGGCETERILFKGPYFVRFTEATGFEKESFTPIIPIEVHLAGPAVDDDLTINYKISGDAREGIDYVVLGDRGVVTIEAGEYFGTIRIQLINNSNNILRSQDIVLTLIGVTGANLEIGQGTSAIGKEYTFTIMDDCILGGSYTGRRGSASLAGIPITSTDCEVYTVSNWNVNVFTSDTEMDLTFVDNGDNTLTIPEQQEAELPDEQNTIIGDGTVNPETREITLRITLVNLDDEPIEVEITYQPE